MYRQICRSSVYFASAVIAPSTVKELSKENDGWDRVKRIFTMDEYGAFTAELSNIYQTTVFTGFVGACYGGFIHSRDAYLSFIERNEASKFTDHFEAKRKLQDHVTLAFGKGALRWSWRLALFGGLYVTFVTSITAYRGEPSIFDYILAGLISGSVYRINSGMRGAIVGGTLGSFVGLIGGGMTLTLLKLSGSTMDDVHDWHLQQGNSRKRHYEEAEGKAMMVDKNRALLYEYDKRRTEPS